MSTSDGDKLLKGVAAAKPLSESSVADLKIKEEVGVSVDTVKGVAAARS